MTNQEYFMRNFVPLGSVLLAGAVSLGLYGLMRADARPDPAAEGVHSTSISAQQGIALPAERSSGWSPAATRDRSVAGLSRPQSARDRSVRRRASLQPLTQLLALQEKSRQETRESGNSSADKQSDLETTAAAGDKPEKRGDVQAADKGDQPAPEGKVLLVFEMISEVPTHWALRDYRLVTWGGRQFLEGTSVSPTSEVDNWDEGLKVRVAVDAIEVLIEFDSLEQYREKMKLESEQERST